MIAKIASGTTSYFLSDRLSARLTLNSSGAVVGQQGHLPFGEDFAESGTQQKQHFTTYERDAESNLDYAMNRSYTAVAGRFQQADPYWASGGAGNPRSWNRYAYVENDPVNAVDPSGLFLAAPGLPVMDQWRRWWFLSRSGQSTPTGDKADPPTGREAFFLRSSSRRTHTPP
jgi:RHS repeat-associated protein